MPIATPCTFINLLWSLSGSSTRQYSTLVQDNDKERKSYSSGALGTNVIHGTRGHEFQKFMAFYQYQSEMWVGVMAERLERDTLQALAVPATEALQLDRIFDACKSGTFPSWMV